MFNFQCLLHVWLESKVRLIRFDWCNPQKNSGIPINSTSCDTHFIRRSRWNIMEQMDDYILLWNELDINHTSDNRWYDISKTNCLHLLYTTFQNSNKEMILFPLRAAIVRGLVRELKNSDSPWQWESHVMPFQIFPVNWVAWMPWNSLGPWAVPGNLAIALWSSWYLHCAICAGH